MTKNLVDPLASEAGIVGHANAVESVPLNIPMDTGAASLSTSPGQAISHASGPHARRNHECSECGHLYDRAQRARDCANKDRGLTPHACRSQCGRGSCTKAYSSEVLLREHIASPGNRVQCPQCLKTVSRKNRARHLKDVHHS
ncbi:hypothetical protein M408DRAFT_333209 [Serendipita vermifera MAFF 305830]|uniref:C2H2-type domain-containing protein n=1 Tax=Serendipita vermifera MAFF 305830 TaxID=933852 RepID=A0A0C3ARC0_SERVB|nr:hypothetical protein M408DRAFT_333209 [Serendipita vermifera MAFF 305830]